MPLGGPGHLGVLKRTLASRCHHLVKTFWGWREQQLPDGTLILTSPVGRIHVTTPGSALLFLSLCYSTGGMPAPEADPPPVYCPERTLRANRIASERRQNHDARQARRAERSSYAGPAPPDTNDDPPRF